MTVLIIDDSDYKVDELLSFFNEKGYEAKVAQSYQSGLRLALEWLPQLLCVDMSIPTFDPGVEEHGGRFRPFGGRDIVSELERRNFRTKVVVVTQFELFGEGVSAVSRSDLMKELSTGFPSQYLGCVFYSSFQSEWKFELERILTKGPKT